MKERRSRASKVHFQHNGNHRTLCGLDGRTTYIVNAMTCRVCMFHYLAESASWARRFLDDLRGKPTVQAGRDQTPPTGIDPAVASVMREVETRGYAIRVGSDGNFQMWYRDPTKLRELAGAGQGHAVAVPAGTATPVNGQEKGLGNGFARAFGFQGGAEKAVRELLTICPPWSAAVQPVMERGGASADAVGVKKWDVAEQPGDAGEVRYEPHRYRKASE